MSKAIADKIDVGVITLPVIQQELDTLGSVITGMGGIKPTHVTDVYKLRRGRYKNVRVWSRTDLGTGRVKDLFMTDANFNLINIDVLKYNFDALGKEWLEC